MSTFRTIFVSSIFLFVLALAPGIAGATGGTVELSPTNKWLAPGETMTVEVYVNASIRINAVEGTVTYPKTLLTATGVSTDGSAMTLWAEQPVINATEGTVRFAGGLSGGFSGKGKVMSIVFRADQAGMARVTIEDSSVLAHDGSATDVTGTAAGGRYTLQAEAPDRVFLEPGDLIKLPDDSNPDTQIDTAVYYYGNDGLRYVFPNSRTYFTWYDGFVGVKSVSATQLGTIGIGGNVTYRPGVKMIKIDSDPKVYAVARGGMLRWVGSEALAVALYGDDWNTKIDDVPDSFFTNYTIGDEITRTTDFVPVETTAGTSSISLDKNLQHPIEVFIGSDGSLTPAVFTVGTGHTARFTNTSTSTQRIKADAGSGIPGLDSAHIPAGMDYAYRFNSIGNFGIHNAGDTSKTGTVVVQ